MLEPEQQVASRTPDPDRPNVLMQILSAWSAQGFKISSQSGIDVLAKEGENASWRRIGLLLMLLLLITQLPNLLSASLLIHLVVMFCNFFIWMGLTYLFARLLRGRGTFLAQCYLLLFPLILTELSFYLPRLIHAFLTLPSLLLVVLQYIVLPVLVCFSGMLSVRALMAVHRLSWGKALIVFLLAALAFVLLSFVPGNPFQF